MSIRVTYSPSGTQAKGNFVDWVFLLFYYFTQANSYLILFAYVFNLSTANLSCQDCTFLEACIENHTKSNLYMDQVEFEPAQQWTATRLEADENSSEISPKIR